MLSVTYRKPSAAEMFGHEVGASYSSYRKIQATPQELFQLKKSELLGGIIALQVPQTTHNIMVMSRELGAKFNSKDDNTIYSTFMRRLNYLAKSELLGNNR